MKSLSLVILLALSSSLAAFGQAKAPGKTATPVATPAVTPAMKPINWKADPAMTEYAKQAGSIAIADWMETFLAKPLPAKRYVILPMASDVDDGYFTLQTRNEFASRALGTEFSLYTRDEPEMKVLIDEIRRGDEEGDTMDPETIQQFGRFQGVQGVIRGRVSGVYVGSANANGIRMADDAQLMQVRILLQAFEVETGRLLWGTEKVASVMLPDDSLVIPGTKRQWILYGAIGLAVIFLLAFILRGLKAANRPR